MFSYLFLLDLPPAEPLPRLDDGGPVGVNDESIGSADELSSLS